VHEKIVGLLRDVSANDFLGRAGGAHLVAADQINAGMFRGLKAAVYVVLDDDGIDLPSKLDRIL
jgi:hypothetical protein